MYAHVMEGRTQGYLRTLIYIYACNPTTSRAAARLQQDWLLLQHY